VNDITKIRKVSLLQHDSSDCGAACLASVIRFWGGNISIERIRNASGTSQSGTTMLGLYQAALQLGIEATGYEANVEEIIKYSNILILHIEKEKGLEHYVVCYGFRNERFIIWDPSTGLDFYSKSDLDKLWHSKKCLGLIQGKNFVHEKSEKKEKRKWILMTLKPDKDVLLVSVFIGIVISVLGLAMAVFTRKLIDEIIPAGKITGLITISALVLILLSAKIVFSALRQSFLLSQGKDLNVRVVSRFYSSLLLLSKPFFDTRRVGDFVARLNDTLRIQRIVSDVAGIYVIDVLVTIFTLILIFTYSATVAVISMVSLPLLFMIVYRKNSGIISLQYDAMAGYAMNESNFINSLKGITEIKCLNWHKPFSERNNYIFSDFQERAVKLGAIKIRLGLLTSLAGTSYLMIVLVFSAVEVIHARLTVGQLMAILTLCSSLLPSVLNLALLPIPLNEARVAVTRMFEFTKLENEEPGSEKKKDLNADRIKLKNISFRFPGQKLLLKDINIDIEKGKIIALVGESGCGKSTLANIIMRFYTQENGNILINDDGSHEDISLENWRSKIGLVPQEIHIFNSTLLENIICEPTEEKLNILATIISENRLEPFFNRFPGGFSTMVGEEGIKLSGGQKQLIAFLRVLVQNPDFIIVDEGTSNMDRESELIITGILKKLKKGKGILLITHRINLIKHLCDYIYILENGKITGNGTHNELVRGENIYQKYWDDFD
jgi:ATP-binding cassette, subfamily C, bacteriocin exporter